MATSSITKQWVINDPQAAERLMRIIAEWEGKEEQAHIQRAREIVSDFESDHPETCYAGDDIRILTSFFGEDLEDVYHVMLMTDHIYDVQFYDDYTILEIFSSCDFRRYEKEDLE